MIVPQNYSNFFVYSKKKLIHQSFAIYNILNSCLIIHTNNESHLSIVPFNNKSLNICD
jgi:hypothetical protein